LPWTNLRKRKSGKDEKNISVKLNRDLKLKATLVKTNKDYDLALLRVDVEDLKAIAIGNSNEMEVGDEVYAIGTPMDESFGQTITKGIISGERLINGIKFIQTDVSINPGNSGGPLINDKGEMIGITTMKIAAQGVEGIGFCIPSNAVLEMLNIKH
jgi:serine protease Do